MFKIKFPENYTLGVLIGLYNLDQPFISWIKSFMSSQYKYSINYLEITNEILSTKKTKKNIDINSDEIGMISLTWLEKYRNSIPGLIIQAFDITDYIINKQNVDINQICEPIIKNINSIKNAYQQSNQLIFIKEFKAVPGIENNIKNNICKHFSFKENNIFFINDIAYQDNNGIMKEMAKLIKENLNEFYYLKIKYYINKYNSEKSNVQKEYAIKYLIKIFFIAKISNIIDMDKKTNYYYYINIAYNILIKMDKKSYMFCNDNLKTKFLEIKNLADFLLEQILEDKNNNQKNIINLIMKHLYIFDCKNFFNEKKEDNLINEFKTYKDISLINMKWKYYWLKLILEKYKSNNENSIINKYILNNLYHIYIFLKKETNFIQEINSRINKHISYNKINPKYIEKIPKLYKMDNNNISGTLNDEENLEIYITNLILDDRNLIESRFILKNIKEYFLINKLNYYDFYLINKHCKDNEYNEDFNKILIKILNINKDNIFKFPNIYSHISNKINKILLELNINKENKDYHDIYFNIIQHYIHYMSLSNKELSKELIDNINEIFSNNNIININNINKIIHLNNLQNKLFNIQINYSKKEVTLLDVINIDMNISLLRKNILMNVEKIIIYFPGNKNNKKENKNYKEIILNKELTNDNSIHINFNYLINFYFNKLYITNIELYLKNKIIINLINREKKDIILYNKDNNKKSIDDIMNIDINNIDKNGIIYLGKEENHLLNITYNLKNNYKDIYIKQVQINIQLLKEIEIEKKKKLEETNNYEFKILERINDYQIIENRYLMYKHENTNLENVLPLVEYILKINDIGNFILNYKFNFTLINKNCPDDICILESNKKLKVKCIEPFGFSKEIKSSLYFINGQTKIKSYPINYPINLISYIENKLSENIIIKKIEHLLNNNSIEFNCPTENLFSKIKNFKLKFSSSEIISIKSKIKSNQEISCSIGKLKITWVSENLNSNKFFSDSYINNSIFDINEININKLSLIVEGKYLKMRNKYQIYIKNIEEKSKIIQMNISEENSNKKYILCGKTNLKGILTPFKEIKILYNVYDNMTGTYIDENKENIVLNFNNIITVNEYCILDILDNKNKCDEKALKNIIYFSPEIFKL